MVDALFICTQQYKDTFVGEVKAQAGDFSTYSHSELCSSVSHRESSRSLYNKNKREVTYDTRDRI